MRKTLIFYAGDRRVGGARLWRRQLNIRWALNQVGSFVDISKNTFKSFLLPCKVCGLQVNVRLYKKKGSKKNNKKKDNKSTDTHKHKGTQATNTQRNVHKMKYVHLGSFYC